MRIAFLHLSDFHIKANTFISKEKIHRIVDTFSLIGEINSCCVLITGDLAYSGKNEEYKIFNRFLSMLISELKDTMPEEYIPLVVVPGNHDLCLLEESRTWEDINDYYKNNVINKKLKYEFGYLENYNEEMTNSYTSPFFIHNDKIGYSFVREIENKTVQFNLINTAPFSTLKPDDKELHYFPHEDLSILKRKENIDYCVTLMHHSAEWFNWDCKELLENEIVQNSEFVFVGHDHVDLNRTISINNSACTWISAAGEMKIGSQNGVDSFNIITLDTGENTFSSYKMRWDVSQSIYTHSTIASNQVVPMHSSLMIPDYAFVQQLSKDTYNEDADFNNYYVFPQLSARYGDQKGIIDSIDDLKDYIENSKKVIITGAVNSGKSLLLKTLFLSYLDEKVPIIKQINSFTRINPNNYLKHWFEECYGTEASFDRYLQYEKDKKIVIIDGWDQLKEGKDQKLIYETLLKDFDYIVLSAESQKTSLIEDVVGSLDNDTKFYELHIKPFFAGKRQELVRRICDYNSVSEDKGLLINSSIDRLFRNNYELFLLTPAFIITYVNYYSDSPSYDYVQGEAIFSTVYHYELCKSIIHTPNGKDNVEEILTALEEVAGYMFENKKDLISTEEFINVVNKYKNEYEIDISPKVVLDAGIAAKVIKSTDDLSMFFANKNHLTFFISKFLLRNCNNDPLNSEGIKYALKNICFGINSDIILFVSYALKSTQLIDYVISEADSLISEWELISLDNRNISILSLSPPIKQLIAPPTAEEENEYKAHRERLEEDQYTEEIIEGRGVFDYDEKEADLLENELLRAIKYTELICKMLPAFNNILKAERKREYVYYIYTYPRRIIYGMLRPIDIHIDEICKEITDYANDNDIRNKKGGEYTPEDIRTSIQNISRSAFLGLYDHFSELCSTTKTIRMLTSRESDDASESIERLLMYEKCGDSESLLKETETLLKKKTDPNVRFMARLIIKKHLLDNKRINKRTKQSMVDKVLTPKRRRNIIEDKSLY